MFGQYLFKVTPSTKPGPAMFGKPPSLKMMLRIAPVLNAVGTTSTAHQDHVGLKRFITPPMRKTVVTRELALLIVPARYTLSSSE